MVLLFLVLFQPFYTALVRQVLYLEILKFHVEALNVRTSSHHTHLDRGVVLHSGIAHHGVSLVIERVEDFDGVETTNSLDPNVRHRLVKGNHTPVAGLVSDHGADLVLDADVLWNVMRILAVSFSNTETISIVLYSAESG